MKHRVLKCLIFHAISDGSVDLVDLWCGTSKLPNFSSWISYLSVPSATHRKFILPHSILVLSWHPRRDHNFMKNLLVGVEFVLLPCHSAWQLPKFCIAIDNCFFVVKGKCLAPTGVTVETISHWPLLINY